MQTPDWNPLQATFELLGRKLELDAARKQTADQARDNFDSSGDGYAMDAYGNTTPRGRVAITPDTLGVSPLVLIGGAVLLLVLVLYVVKK